MPLKTAYLPHLGRPVKMGRKRPEPPARPPLRFESLAGAKALPPPPAAVDYSPKGQPALSLIFGNDTLGDCVIAMLMHLLALLTGNAGKLYTATMAQVISYYHAIGGYVPGDPATDQGCDEVTALNYLRTTGFPNGTRLAGWATIDAANKTLMMQALDLFEGGLFFAVELPGAWLNPAPAGDGFVWGVTRGGPDPDNGHAFLGVGYNAQGILIDTWGLIGVLTWEAAAAYAVESAGGAAYVVLSPDQIAAGQVKAPNGLDWPTLVSDLDALGGTVPIPQPTPTPPTPAPPLDYDFQTATALTVAPNPAPAGRMVVMSAAVTTKLAPDLGAAGLVTGAVTFRVGGTASPPMGLISGVATFANPTIPPGTYTVTAEYHASGAFEGSKSDPVTLVVTGAPTPTPTPAPPPAPPTLAQALAAVKAGITAAHVSRLDPKPDAIDAAGAALTALWRRGAAGGHETPPQGEPMDTTGTAAAAATPVLDIVTRAMAFVVGHVDLAELSRVVIAAELAAPGLQSAVAAVKANEALIFKDALARMSADAVLSLLLDTAKHAAVAPAAP